MSRLLNILFLIIFVAAPLNPYADETPFASPTELFVEAHGLDQIKRGLKNNQVPISFYKLFEKAQSNEVFGFFGYHGSCRDFRIYQDLIRIGIEEVLDLPIRKDFHFLRIPGDMAYDLEGTADFFELYPYVYDLSAEQQARLVSLQIALYNECLTGGTGSCPTGFFATNSSLTTVNYPNKLKAFFQLLGIDPEKVNQAFKIGRDLLPDDRGVLLQFFDMSHKNGGLAFYDLLDMHAYASHPLGTPYGDELPSHYLFSYDVLKYPSVYPQLRLVVSNRHTLNPNSSILIKRYDDIDPREIKKYENALRRFFQQQKINKQQKDRYRTQLESLWN